MTFKPVAIPYMTTSNSDIAPGEVSVRGLDTYAPRKSMEANTTKHGFPFNGVLDASFILGCDPLFVVRDGDSERKDEGKLLIICADNILTAQTYTKACLIRPDNQIAHPLNVFMTKKFLAETDEDYPEISRGSLVIALTRMVPRDQYGRLPVACFYPTRRLLGQFTSFCRLLAKGISSRPDDEILTVTKLVKGYTRPATLNDGRKAVKYIPYLDKRTTLSY